MRLACEDETTLLKYAGGELQAAEVARVERHLDGCNDCRQLVAAVARDFASQSAVTDPGGASVATVTDARPSRRALQTGLRAGALIGRYQLLEPLGSGGMGIVWAAYDPQLHRKLALKLIALRAGDEKDPRMLREAQAMAQLDHPNVVSVYDAGTWEGGFYIAMELVAGVNLRQWLAKERSWREIVAAFVTAGRGLGAAHAIGLVHRDFKPDNVLVAESGAVRVTDFGLVRAASERRPTSQNDPLQVQLTRNDAMMGTPGYFAPELLTSASAVTAASDQFSFCAALYEALTGTMPFPGDNLVDQAVAAREGRLAAPLRGRAPGWVLELLRRGLSSEPAQRFPSLDGLLDRLADDPTRRTRAWFALAGAAAGLLVVGAAWQHARLTACSGFEADVEPAWNEAVAKRGEAAFAATQRPYAAEAWGRAKQRLDRYAQAWVAARAGACEANQQHGQSDAVYAMRVDCLEQLRDELRSVAEALASADVTVVAAAGGAVSELPAVDACADAKTLRPPRPKEGADALRALRAELVGARTLLFTGQLAAAVASAKPLFARAQSLKEPLLIAETALVLGEAQEKIGDPGCLEVFEAGAAAAAAAGDDERLVLFLAHQMTERGMTLAKAGEARALVPLATGIATRIPERNRALGRLSQARGQVEWQDGKLNQALTLQRRALEHFSREPGDDSLDAAHGRYNLGWILMELGQLDEARLQLERARSIFEQIYGEKSPALFDIWNAMAGVEHERGDYEAATACSRRTLELAQATQPEASALAPLYVNLAQSLAQSGHADEAAELVERGIALMEADTKRPHRRVAAITIRGVVAYEQGDFARAVAAHADAVRLGRKAFGDRHPRLVEPLTELARAQLAAGQLADAWSSADEALAIAGDDPGISAPVRGQVLGLLGRTRLAQKKAAEARGLLERSLAQFEGLQGFNPYEIGTERLALAEAQWQTGAVAEARKTAGTAALELSRSPRNNARAAADDWLAQHAVR